MVFSFRRRAAWPLFAFVALALFACHPKVTDPKDPTFVVAQTDKWNITRAQLDHEINSYFKQNGTTPAQIGANMPALETAILRNLVLEHLLLDRAESMNFKDVDKTESDAFGRIKAKFPNDQMFQDKLKQTGMSEDELKKQIHDRVLIEKLFEADAVKNAEPSDKEVNDFYLGHKDLFRVPLKLRASRILVKVDEGATPVQKATARKKIDTAHARVVKGEEISKVASEVSDDQYSAPKGGDIGYFQRGENETGFDDVAFASKVGTLSPVFETPAGFNFLKVTEIKPPGVVGIDEARIPIIENLRKMKVSTQEEAYAEKTMKDAKVTYNIPLTELPPEKSAGPNAVPTDASPAPGAGSPPPDMAAPAPADAAILTRRCPLRHQRGTRALIRLDIEVVRLIL